MLCFWKGKAFSPRSVKGTLCGNFYWSISMATKQWPGGMAGNRIRPAMLNESWVSLYCPVQGIIEYLGLIPGYTAVLDWIASDCGSRLQWTSSLIWVSWFHFQKYINDLECSKDVVLVMGQWGVSGLDWSFRCTTLNHWCCESARSDPSHVPWAKCLTNTASRYSVMGCKAVRSYEYCNAQC